jgi:hypothetical protein
MPDAIKNADVWFLQFLIFALASGLAILGGYAVWSLRGLLQGLQHSIDKLDRTIQELFEHRNNHADRIKALETRCAIKHKYDMGCLP